eukprot:gnl/MRDRNA2_/MRDRNA2_150494_c0_seq1.p1 gnl/MRDRNA2_/MRDRNA2_150494_c0~~gnl/MRDRNA2_/MRDRNA2_150494_c0_seq1.p1  ORF type:complete len:379 (-),score=50.99 gnl/MRDRNA2_/MRDRNA2_150494_c0_seq1:60-1196(-)
MEGQLVGERFNIHSKLASGSFAEIYEGINQETGAEVAVKVEPILTSERPSCLLYEAKVLKCLESCSHVTRVIWSGSHCNHRALVMDMLGPSLEILFDAHRQRFSLKTTLMLGDQMLQRLESIHNKGFIHRDVKPSNFLIGRKGRGGPVHIVSFSLAKRYRDPKTKQHMPYKEKKIFQGCALYASVNVHLGVEPSRRDDVESVCYILLHFLLGRLPWQGLKAQSKKEALAKVRNAKSSIPLEALCQDAPQEFCAMLKYTRSLAFDQQPDYTYLRRLLKDVMVQEQYVHDLAYDWVNSMAETHKDHGETGKLMEMALPPINTFNNGASGMTGRLQTSQVQPQAPRTVLPQIKHAASHMGSQARHLQSTMASRRLPPRNYF